VENIFFSSGTEKACVMVMPRPVFRRCLVWMGHQLSRLRFTVVFLTPSMEIPEQYLS
jgi:hypothetical protein